MRDDYMQPLGEAIAGMFKTYAGNYERALHRNHDEVADVSPPEAELVVALAKIGLRPAQQHPVGPYDLDFYFEDAKLCVEVDGIQHFELDHSIRDERRDRYLKRNGIDTVRIPASDVLKDPGEAARLVQREVATRTGPRCADCGHSLAGIRAFAVERDVFCCWPCARERQK